MTFIEQCYRNGLHLERLRMSNTVVRTYYNRIGSFWIMEVMLHSTPIVRVYRNPDINAVSLFDGGFRSAVTMRRMNYMLGHGTERRAAPSPTPYSVFKHRSQWYIRDEVSMTTVPWEGGKHFIISPKYNVGYATDRIPSGWLNE